MCTHVPTWKLSTSISKNAAAGFFEPSVHGELSERVAPDSRRLRVILGGEPVHKLKIHSNSGETMELVITTTILLARVLFFKKR